MGVLQAFTIIVSLHNMLTNINTLLVINDFIIRGWEENVGTVSELWVKLHI